MYTFSKRLKIFSIILILLGAIGWFMSYSSSHHVGIEDVKVLLAEESAHGHGGHGETHAPAEESHDTGAHHDNAHGTDTHSDEHEGTAHSHDDSTHTHADEHHHNASHTNEGHGDTHHENGHGTELHEDAHHGDAHAEHVMHQIHNRPYAALYVAAFFFFMIALGTLAFYGVQRASMAGWSPLLFRVMEAITYYVLPGGLLVLLVAYISDTHVFIWMNENMSLKGHEDYDKLVAGKVGWLNKSGFMIRGIIYLAGWSLYRYFSRKFSLAQDNAEDDRNFKKNFRISAAFLVFYIYTESMMSWDWIMSVDPHWFSTLFGWYVFASMFVSGITVIALITIYLKSKGLLEEVNDSHLHDLAKFMFGISVFWTYLWFSQFMLIWFADIPEEVTYYVTRIEDYKLPFFGMLLLNFIFPFLVLMNSDYKRIPWFIVMAGVIILIGHYMDVYNMIMPATVGDRWGFGLAEISAIAFFAGLFMLCVLYALSKETLVAKRNPLIKESRHFHY
ncbi:MAG: quinol:cytochrome C oxidoreductase [Flavobacteriaceae bacterium]|nr:quinol:cytochrome C oxidoreductase [Flavobacteriaceae bacterium]